ncbi:MAG: maleylpyruvate isomerase family mycothiol-dependent enzyme [Frankiaceae bacterium]|nr:maleylpyruvate isomerase family mycothiol-dependent enzyme [Frankiaceae bacterium]
MDFDTHLRHLVAHGQGLADSAAAAGLDAPVPTCPEWTVRDLVTHQSQVHRWARSYVATGRTTPPSDEDELAEPPADDELLIEWFRAGHEELVAALCDAPADLDCWSFLPAPSPREFWARRQAHETTIHRVDADRAAGRTTEIDPMLAIDGIDELLRGFFARARGSLVSDPPRKLAVVTADVGDAWTMTIGPDRRTTASGADADANVMISGDAADIYLLLWNRGGRERISVDGDESLLDLWRDKAQIRWR